MPQDEIEKSNRGRDLEYKKVTRDNEEEARKENT
jgi:hypothetical protein